MNSRELLLLCKKMQSGDEQAFAELYKSCYAPIYYYIYGMTYSKEESEDVTQETFMKVAKSIHTFSSGNLLSWMYTIARNVLFDRSRKNKHTTPLHEGHENSLGSEFDIDAEMQLGEDMRNLENAMKRLPLHERELLVLKFWNGLDMKEIATIVGKSHVAMRKEMSRIIGRLRNIMEVTAYEPI